MVCIFPPMGLSHEIPWGAGLRGRGAAPPPRAGSSSLASGPSLHPNLVVHGDAVGPADADVHQHHPLTAVQPRPLDPRVLAPLGPEQVPGVKVEAGVSPQSTDENGPVARGPGQDQSQEWGLVRPARSSPLLRVDSDRPGLVQTLGDDHVAERAIEPGNFDDVETLVRPVDVACGGREGRRSGGTGDS